MILNRNMIRKEIRSHRKRNNNHLSYKKVIKERRRLQSEQR